MRQSLLVLALLASLLASQASADEYTYDPIGKRDPFRGLLHGGDRPATPAGGILAQWDLSQLRLVAVALTFEGGFALVEPPEGPAALLAEGSRIGRELAEVVRISPDRVLLRQERWLPTGSLAVDHELRLDGPSAALPMPAPGP